VRRAVVLIALAALAAPASAFAHASVHATQPSYRERLERAPRTVWVQFDQGVKAFRDSIVVLTATGKIVSGPARTEADPHTMFAKLHKLPRGAYTVRWHALSSDGHVVSGVWTFGVGVAAPPPTEAYGASGPTRTEHLVRWAYFLGLALLIGGLGFRLLIVRGPLPPAAESRFFRLTGLGVVAVLEVGIVAFILRAEDALQLPFGKLLYGDLSPIAGGTRFGTAFIAMQLGFAVVAALLFLAWLLEKRMLLWLAFAVSLVFASGLSLSGHSAADAGSSWKSELADWVHLTAACLWLGGLIQLAVVMWPRAPELRREAFARFARTAPVLIALIVAAGIYLSVLRLPRLSDLWTESYGHVLLVKLALVSLALVWGGLHHTVAGPLVERGHPAVAKLSRSLLGEASVGMAVLLAAAVLVDSKPPPQPAGSSPPTASLNRAPGPPAARGPRRAREATRAVTVSP
jgi:copper transport protein